MITVWGPGLDLALRVLYVRVIEIPTPRWTAYDGHYNQDAQRAPMTTTERAYTPIWYTP
jgi:hypothetical protein